MDSFIKMLNKCVDKRFGTKTVNSLARPEPTGPPRTSPLFSVKAVPTLQSKSSQLVEYETKVTVKIQLQHCTTIHQLLVILLVQRGLLSDKVPFPNQLLGSDNFPSYIELVRHVAAICLLQTKRDPYSISNDSFTNHMRFHTVICIP